MQVITTIAIILIIAGAILSYAMIRSLLKGELFLKEKEEKIEQYDIIKENENEIVFYWKDGTEFHYKKEK